MRSTRPTRQDLASIRQLAARLYREGHNCPHRILVESYADARRPATCTARYNLPLGTWTTRHGIRNYPHLNLCRLAVAYRIAAHERQGFQTPADRIHLYGDTCSGFNRTGKHALA